MSVDWGERVAWKHRSAWFGQLRVHGEFRKSVVMELEPESGEWRGGRELWLSLPKHPNVLEAMEPSSERGLLLRYAAIDWNYNLDYATNPALATWGAQLVNVCSMLLSNVNPRQLGRLAEPLVEIDVGGHLRLGFLPVDEGSAFIANLPKDLRRAWPGFGEAGLIHTIGVLLDQLIGSSKHAAMSQIARRCVEPNPKSRYKSLEQLDHELRMAGASRAAVRNDYVLSAWRLAEEGLGWLELGDDVNAEVCFKHAKAGMAYEAIVSWGLARTAAHLGKEPPRGLVELDPSIKSGTVFTRALSWAEAEDEGLRLESQRAFTEALNLYLRCNPGAQVGALNTALARCYLRLGQLGHALVCAQLAFLSRTSDIETCELYIDVLLQRRSFDEALNIADHLLGVAAERGRARYLRGKALFALGRMVDARDAFEYATKLDPKLIEAQLLRREVERVTGNVRQTVGKQHAPTFDIPEQLAELRDVLISGNTSAAITALRDDRYARDADAQLLLGRLLAFDKRLDEAIAVYDQLAATSHRTAALVGKATALLELGRAGDALSIVEQLPDDADAAELHARALEALGRHDEAAEAYRRFIALASSGSDLRVRVAQLALDEIEARRRA